MADIGAGYESFDIEASRSASSSCTDLPNDMEFDERGDMDGVQVEKTNKSVDLTTWWIKGKNYGKLEFKKVSGLGAYQPRVNKEKQFNWPRVWANLSNFGSMIAEATRSIRNCKVSFCCLSAYVPFRSSEQPNSDIEVAIDRGLATTSDREKVSDFERPREDSLTRHEGGRELLEAEKQEIIDYVNPNKPSDSQGTG